MKDYMAYFEESYRRLTRDSGVRGDFIERFYERFIAGSPDVARRFELTDMRRQQLMLARSLDEMARFSKDRRAPETLRRTAARHGPGDLGIPPGLYDQWLESLLASVREFDPECSDEVLLAWRIVLAPGIEYMRHHPPTAP
jgi:hemoglobin-like flavoprotein